MVRNDGCSVPNLKNRIDPQVESSIVQYAIDEPAHRQVRVSNKLRKTGVYLSRDFYVYKLSRMVLVECEMEVSYEFGEGDIDLVQNMPEICEEMTAFTRHIVT